MGLYIITYFRKPLFNHYQTSLYKNTSQIPMGLAKWVHVKLNMSMICAHAIDNPMCVMGGFWRSWAWEVTWSLCATIEAVKIMDILRIISLVHSWWIISFAIPKRWHQSFLLYDLLVFLHQVITPPTRVKTLCEWYELMDSHKCTHVNNWYVCYLDALPWRQHSIIYSVLDHHCVLMMMRMTHLIVSNILQRSTSSRGLHLPKM